MRKEKEIRRDVDTPTHAAPTGNWREAFAIEQQLKQQTQSGSGQPRERLVNLSLKDEFNKSKSSSRQGSQASLLPKTSKTPGFFSKRLQQKLSD